MRGLLPDRSGRGTDLRVEPKQHDGRERLLPGDRLADDPGDRSLMEPGQVVALPARRRRDAIGRLQASFQSPAASRRERSAATS